MRILFDENLDWRLRRGLPGHTVETVQSLRWSGTKNGRLLRKAVAAGFDVFLTMDGNVAYEQNLPEFDIAVFVLGARSNRLEHTLPLMKKVLAMLPRARSGRRTMVR